MAPERNRSAHDFGRLFEEILHLGNHEIPRHAVLAQASRLLLGFSDCDAVDICVREEDRLFLSSGSGSHDTYHTANRAAASSRSPLDAISLAEGSPTAQQALCFALVDRGVWCTGAKTTPAGSVWTESAGTEIEVRDMSRDRSAGVTPAFGEGIESHALIPFVVEHEDRGLVALQSKRAAFFTRGRVMFYETIAQILGVTLVHRRTQLALRERVKEMTCLFGIAKLVGTPSLSAHEIMRAAVELLPPAWLYPEISSGRIVLDGISFLSTRFREGVDRLQAEIVVDGVERGRVELNYADSKPEIHEGPFLREERSLIDTIAKELSLAVKHRQAEQEREKLQDQLRHADRLATIGQLSAGVAHELNEPLAAILGFSQLALKDSLIPAQVKKDVERIVKASLHGREVVQKLMLFAHQTPPEKNWVNLNLLAEDGMYFLESRCAKSGIEVIRRLQPGLPEIEADPGQIYQVLVNLTVNAIQAMPNGGVLTIRTAATEREVFLSIQDTGAGMSPEVKDKIFIPFFTTKDVGEGTGLGLAVVGGIVSSHGGGVDVYSEAGVGTTFTVHLPFGAGREKNQET